MIELTTHETLDVLRQLAPEGIVAGGSFATWLPHPFTLAGEDRSAAFASARERAVNQCIRTLLPGVGISENTPVPTGDGGQREWPAGFRGSLTHKGTLVLGILAASSIAAMIGIDLERKDRARSALAAIQDVV